MYELVKLGERTYYIDCPSKIGIVLLENNAVCLIDSANGKDTGRKVWKILSEQGWTLNRIVHTHAHADHIGGSALLQARSGCPVYAPGVESAFASYPALEADGLYGGCAPKPLHNKFLRAEQSAAEPLKPAHLPQGMDMLPLPGHSQEMTAFRTPDGVWFVGDCVTGAPILTKYRLTYVYDVRAFLKSLDRLETLEGTWFVPAHAEPMHDIRPLAALNRQAAHDIAQHITDICRTPGTHEDVLKALCDTLGVTLDVTQHALLGSTVRAYLTFLYEEGQMDMAVTENRMMWQTKPGAQQAEHTL